MQGFLPPSVSKASDNSSLGEIADNCANGSDNAIKEHNSVPGMKQLMILGMRGALNVRQNTTESRFIPSDFIKANRFIYTSPRRLNSLVVTVRNC